MPGFRPAASSLARMPFQVFGAFLDLLLALLRRRGCAGGCRNRTARRHTSATSGRPLSSPARPRRRGSPRRCDGCRGRCRPRRSAACRQPFSAAAASASTLAGWSTTTITSRALPFSSISRAITWGVTTGEVMCTLSTPASASASASPSFGAAHAERARRHLAPGDVGRLVGLGVWPEVDFVRLGEARHLGDVAVEHLEVEHKRWRIQRPPRALLADEMPVQALRFAHFF